MSAPRPATALAVAAIAAAAAGGCGEKREDVGGGGGTDTATSVNAGTTVAVTETDFAIDPKAPEVATAGVVAFEIENRGKVDHALEIELPDGEIDTDSIPPGESATLKAGLKPGTYRWYCPLGDHADRGMEGEVVVAGGGEKPSPGSEKPSPGGY